MKGINNFFFRLDLPRYACLFLVLPFAIFSIFSKVAFAYFYIFIPLLILLILGCLFRVNIPGEDEILNFISSNHSDYLRQVVRTVEGKREEDAYLLDGFSTQKSLLHRKIGSNTVYPICRSVVFLKDGDELIVSVKDSPVMKIKHEFEGGTSFTPKEPIAVSIGKYNEKTKNYLVTLSFDDTKFSLYIKEKYKLKEIFEKYKKHFKGNFDTIKD